jgi:hypothetical protein
MAHSEFWNFESLGYLPYKFRLRMGKWKGKERNSDGWVTLLHAGHDLGLMCFPFFHRIFLPQYKYCMLLVGNQVLSKLQCKFLHFKSTRADVHYASALFETTPPTYITLPYPGFEPGTFGFQVGNATNWAIEVGMGKWKFCSTNFTVEQMWCHFW